MKHRLVGLLTAVAVVVVALVAQPRPGFALSPTRAPFGIRPGASGQVPLPAGHFQYDLPAGSRISDSLVIVNLTQAPLQLSVYPADLVELSGGGVTPAPHTAKPVSVGAWIKMAHGQVTLSAAQQLSVPFTLQVPVGTAPGDYGGAVVVESGIRRTVSGKTNFDVSTREALEVQVQVPGRLHAAGKLGPLQARSEGGTVHFSVSFQNTGNVSLTFNGQVQLQRGGSATVVDIPLRPGRDFLLPDTHLTLSGTWSNTPIWGSVEARAHVVATVARHAPLQFGTQTVALKFFPWLLVILAILALILLLLVLRMAARRRQLGTARFRAWRQRRQALRDYKRQLA